MKIQLNLIGIILILSAVLGTFFLGKGFGSRSRDNQIQTLSQALNDQQQSIKRYEITIDSLTEYVSQMHYVKISDENLIATLKIDNERLKALNMKSVETIAGLQATVEVLNKKLIPVKDTSLSIDNYDIDISQSEDGSPCLPLPQDYMFNDKWAYNHIRIAVDGEASTDFGLYTTPVNVIIGLQKEKWYKNREGVIAVTTPSPYLKLDPHQVTVIKPKTKWYRRNIVWLAGGFIGGLLIQ